MSHSVYELIRSQIDAHQLAVGGTLGIFIAGPIDEDYVPKVNNHHWEIATLAPVEVLGLSIDLNCCEIIDAESKEIDDCHGWLSLDTDGKEHTLGVLLVQFSGTPNTWRSLTPTVLGNGSYLPIAVTFLGRNRNNSIYRNVITQWHEELLKFVIGGVTA